MPARYCFCADSDAVPSSPPSPIVSTALDGTITIEPFSLIASYSMFIARRCSATGLLMYTVDASREFRRNVRLGRAQDDAGLPFALGLRLPRHRVFERLRDVHVANLHRSAP